MIIRRLPEEVVNRIAAGEILHRPVNAVKELMENSLDAKATQIQVTVDEGGLKLLQIQDDGSGIMSEDLKIVCERFTTSKLTKFEDLQSIATFGFRGEALASISHVSRLSIISRTADSPCAFKAHYSDGRIVDGNSQAKPCAGNVGTTITIQDLFYNVPMRRKSFKSSSAATEEYRRIVECVMRYAIHYPTVRFSCRKLGSNSHQDVCTIGSGAGEDSIDAIRQLFPQALTKELLKLSSIDADRDIQLTGYVSNSSYSALKQRSTIILFINNRLVESQTIKRSLEIVYSRYLLKGSHPWVYLSIKLPAHKVDVNVHPTKKEVHFLDEDSVIENIVAALTETLASSTSSKTFITPSIPAPINHVPVDNIKRQQQSASDSHPTMVNEPPTTTLHYTAQTKVPEYRLVRTDSRLQTLDTFVTTKSDQQRSSSVTNSSFPLQTTPISSNIHNASMEVEEEMLTSVLELRQAIKDAENPAVTDIFKNHKWIGCVNATRILVQYKTRLLMVDIDMICQRMWYELILKRFGKFEQLELETPISIQDLIQLHCETQMDTTKYSDTTIHRGFRSLLSMCDMMQEYFGISISKDGNLCALPVLHAGYIPQKMRLPQFFFQIVTEIDWSSEKQCLESLARAIAWLYVPEPDCVGEVLGDDQEWKKEFRWSCEHVFASCLRKCTGLNDMLPCLNELAELELLLTKNILNK